MSTVDTRAVVRELWPLLEVSDINRAAAFYRDQLAFDVVADDAEPGGQMGWCRLVRGGASLMLQGRGEEGGRAQRRGRGVCLYFVCDDADAVYRELSSRGLRLEAPEVAYYGMKQLYLTDPDGYEVCFESPASAPSDAD